MSWKMPLPTDGKHINLVIRYPPLPVLVIGQQLCKGSTGRSVLTHPSPQRYTGWGRGWGRDPCSPYFGAEKSKNTGLSLNWEG